MENSSSPMTISPELSGWCAKAGWTVQEAGGATELRPLNAESHLSVTARNSLAGTHEVFEIDRAGHGYWVIEAGPEDIERYLAVRLSATVRANLGFQPLAIPSAEGEEAPGFTLDFEDVAVIVMQGTAERAFFPMPETDAPVKAWVQFTHYATLYLPELYAMLAEADGDGPFAPA